MWKFTNTPFLYYQTHTKKHVSFLNFACGFATRRTLLLAHLVQIAKGLQGKSLEIINSTISKESQTVLN